MMQLEKINAVVGVSIRPIRSTFAVCAGRMEAGADEGFQRSRKIAAGLTIFPIYADQSRKIMRGLKYPG